MNVLETGCAQKLHAAQMEIDMTIKFLATAAFIIYSAGAQAEDITNRIQEMRKFSDQEEARQSQEKYKEYLRNNDNANGISQRTGPSGSNGPLGPTGGYQWSTK